MGEVHGVYRQVLHPSLARRTDQQSLQPQARATGLGQTCGGGDQGREGEEVKRVVAAAGLETDLG